MSRRSQLYALLAGALLTLLVLSLDLAGPRSAVPDALRSAGASATGPLLTTVARAFPQPPAHELALTETSARLALTEDALREATASADLLMSATLTAPSDTAPTETDPAAAPPADTAPASPDPASPNPSDTDPAVPSPAGPNLTTTPHDIVLARIVAIGALGPAGPERLTIDVGTRDGIGLDQSVVASDGLVGRTVRVGTSTSDVLILGAPDLVAGARIASSGLLGTAGPPTAGDGPREPGQLTFTAIAFGDAAAGERLVTVGSPDNAPFVAGVPIGTLAAVDPSDGQVGLTAAVTPAVDIATLDVVAVIVPAAPTGQGR